MVLAAGCAASEDTTARIAVAEDNELGVTAIEISRYEDEGDRVFELRGLDAAGQSVAQVRLRTGHIADLPEHLPGADTHGSELIVAAGGKETRVVSRETQRHQLMGVDPALERFVQLAPVKAALAEANVHVPSEIADVAYGHYGNGAWDCVASELNTEPNVSKCCNSWDGTLFVNPENAIVGRQRNFYGTACTASDHVSACSGASCYFGPNRFARAAVTAPTSSTPYPWVWPDPFMGTCYGRMDSTPQSVNNLHSAVGTFAKGRGCCVNGAGACGPGLQSCASCGGGGAAGAGAWDY